MPNDLLIVSLVHEKDILGTTTNKIAIIFTKENWVKISFDFNN